MVGRVAFPQHGAVHEGILKGGGPPLPLVVVKLEFALAVVFPLASVDSTWN
jgi:hypothetical protein